LYYDTNITLRILLKRIKGYEAGALELGIISRDGAQIKDPELRSKFRTRAGAMDISEIARSSGPGSLRIGGFTK